MYIKHVSETESKQYQNTGKILVAFYLLSVTLYGIAIYLFRESNQYA